MQINDVVVDPANILYAGVVPKFAGLFQINVRPTECPAREP